MALKDLFKKPVQQFGQVFKDAQSFRQNFIASQPGFRAQQPSVYPTPGSEPQVPGGIQAPRRGSALSQGNVTQAPGFTAPAAQQTLVPQAPPVTGPVAGGASSSPLDRTIESGFMGLIGQKGREQQKRSLMENLAVATEGGRREYESFVGQGGLGGPGSSVTGAGKRELEAGLMGQFGQAVTQFEQGQDRELAQVLPNAAAYSQAIAARGDAQMQQAYDFIGNQIADARARNDDAGVEYWANRLEPIAGELGIPFQPYQKGQSQTDLFMGQISELDTALQTGMWQGQPMSEAQKEASQGILDLYRGVTDSTSDENLTETSWGGYNSKTNTVVVNGPDGNAALTLTPDMFVDEQGFSIAPDSGEVPSKVNKLMKDAGLDTNNYSKNDMGTIYYRARRALEEEGIEGGAAPAPGPEAADSNVLNRAWEQGLDIDPTPENIQYIKENMSFGWQSQDLGGYGLLNWNGQPIVVKITKVNEDKDGFRQLIYQDIESGAVHQGGWGKP